MSTVFTNLTPRLVVTDADATIRFYETVFDAVAGIAIRAPDGTVVHAELDMGGMRLSLTEANGKDHRSPGSLGGSPVFLVWHCDDPDEVEAKAVHAGATVVYPVENRYYGMRDGRFTDPEGHVWMVSKTLAHYTSTELQERTDNAMRHASADADME